MKFSVHTDRGVYQVDARTPEEARRIVHAMDDAAQVKKIKLAAGQRGAMGQKEKQA